MLSEARVSDEKARSCMLDAARLAEELRAEQAQPVFISVKHGRPIALLLGITITFYDKKLQLCDATKLLS